ncbi:MAG: hypothetical protein KF799_05735 [Bdellovibrionales bacterium]|nr:hypothetical protein [Bdellovibrionales bacterium]
MSQSACASNFRRAVVALAERGLNVFAGCNIRDLPEDIVVELDRQGVSLNSALFVVGNGGRRLWEAIHEEQGGELDCAQHPIDRFSVEQVRCFQEQVFKDAKIEWLYPHSRLNIPLQRIGRALNIARRSNLGLDMHREFGPWFAYRAVFTVEVCEAVEVRREGGGKSHETRYLAPEDQVANDHAAKDHGFKDHEIQDHGLKDCGPQDHGFQNHISPYQISVDCVGLAELFPVAEPFDSPCETCVTKACVSACPAAAVSIAEPLNLSNCAHFRLTPNSTCADRCQSRIACPAGKEHRYTIEQIQYHMGRPAHLQRLAEYRK